MKCSICWRDIDPEKDGGRFGNSAWPVNDGRCCTQCDCDIVIPRRLRQSGFSDEYAKAVGKADLKLRQIKPHDLPVGFEAALKKAGFQTGEQK